MQRDNVWTDGTGYELRSVHDASATTASLSRQGVRWGRLTFAQLRDADFLAKQLRRLELTQEARRTGRSEAISTSHRTIQQRLLAAQTKANRETSEDEEFDAKDETELARKQTTDSDDHEKSERELTNALCVLGHLQQPELAAFLVMKLKETLRRLCTFPNPVYKLIALRRQLIQNMHEAVAVQHRQRKTAMQFDVAISKCLENTLLSDTAPSPCDPVELLSGSAAIKSKEKVSREATMGIRVLLCLLSDLQDPALATLTQRREFLEDLIPLLRSMSFLSLSPRRGHIDNSSVFNPLTSRGSSRLMRVSSGATETAEFTDKIQHLLLDMCPRPVATIPSSSPKLSIASGKDELDVLDRTNAVNGLIHLAAATGSVRDFLVVLRVLLGATDVKDQRRLLSSRSLLTCSVPSLTTIQAEDLVPSPLYSGRDDDELTQGKLKAGATRPDSSKPRKKSPLSKRETEVLGDCTVPDPLKRKTIPKGLKTIGASLNTGTVTINVAMSQHRLLYSSPGNNLMSKQRPKDEPESVSLLLDMSKMKESQSRETAINTRSETPVVTARCPTFKTLAVQSVLVELASAKPSTPTRTPRGKSTARSSHVECFSTDSSVYDEDGEREVWSCGQNSYGELGHGDTASRNSFERVESLQHKEILQLGAGNEHTVVLTADGTVLTCGYNDNGQCGQGGTTRVNQLSEIPKLTDNIAQVHAYNGCEHTILVTTDGRAATCGYNYRGQLGHGNTASESVPKIVRSLENRIVRLVSCSYYHTVMACEEDASGQQYLYTFGRNDYGQLGHNDSIDRKVPQHVEALREQHVVSVACGQYHTLVVTATGKAFAFGKNDYGQLGIESMDNQLVPIQIRNGLEKHECLEIRSGYYHTIVLCSGAHLFGFGRNDYGQLGLGRANASSNVNLQLQQQRFTSARLIEELEGKDIVRLACGCYHTVAVSDNGLLYVFGRNNHGQLGTGDTKERMYPFPIDQFVGKRVALVAAGFYHTVVLTGGQDDRKIDQDVAGIDKGEACTTSNFTGLTHTTILSSAAVQQLLNPSKCPEFDSSGRPISFILNEISDSGVEVPAIDPTDEDFRDEDREFPRNSNSDADERDAKAPTDAGDALFVAVVIFAQLDRLCQPFIPKTRSFPTLHHPTLAVIEALTANTTSSSATSSFDASCIFEGSFESFGIHNCSSTFQSLAVLLKHLSTRKIESTSQLTSCLAAQSGPPITTTTTPTPATPSSQLQMYMLLATIRILQANLSQILRSGMAKAVVQLSSGPSRRTNDVKSWIKELERTRMAILQVREVLLSLIDIKHRRTVCYILDKRLNDGENTTRIAQEATTTLLLGFELFFPCQCLQRQLYLHTMHEFSSNDHPEYSCREVCRRDLWLLDTLPRSRSLLLEPLLRRMTEDAVLTQYLPLQSTSLSVSDGSSTSMATEVYKLLLDRIATEFSRRLGDVVAIRPSIDENLRQETTLRAVFELLGGLLKHFSSFAASIPEWTLKDDAESNVTIETRVADVVDRVFRVDDDDFDRIPVPWHCLMEFVLATLTQCGEVLNQVSSIQSLPSPTHGYKHDIELDLQESSLHVKVLDIVESSVVGQFLPLLVLNLFEFSNNSLFAAALLPTLMTLLRLLDGFNQRDSAVEAAEKRFVDNIAASRRPGPAQNEKNSASVRQSESNVLSLGSYQDGDTKGLATSEAMTLPWHYRLEKELAVLAAEMAVTLIIGDPFFTYDVLEDKDTTNSFKLSDRWLSSVLFRGGLNSKYLTQSIKQRNSIPGRTVQHTPFPATISGNSRPFSLILPPSTNEDEISSWQLPTTQNYRQMFHPDCLRTFLALFQQGNDSEHQTEASLAVMKLCDWIRDSYAKQDPSYRMLLRQSQLALTLKPSTPSIERQIHENDARIEAALFAALLHHNLFVTQAFHFAISLDCSALEARASPPRTFLSLWQYVAQLRRRVAAKKTEIKSMAHPDAASDPRVSALTRISVLQQTILDRLKLLLLLDVYDEQEHLSLQFDAGYIAPYDPAFLVSASSTFKFSASSAKRHFHSIFTNEKLPFLAAFPLSKWRKLRTALHTVIRWKSLVTESQHEAFKQVSQEILAFVLSDELVSSKRAIQTLLVDPCRRVSCSVRGLEAVWELVTLVSFDSIQTDIVHQISQVFVFEASPPSFLSNTQRVGYFYSSLQNETVSELIGQLTDMMTDKAVVLMESGESDTTPTFWIVIVLLSVWGVHINADQFEFVSEIGILKVIQEMMQTLSSKRRGDVNGAGCPSIPSVDSIGRRSGGQSSRALFTTQQLAHLEETLWVLFRYICVHFAVQKGETLSENFTQRDINVPTFPVLSTVAELLFNEAATISYRFLPLQASMAQGSGKQVEPVPAVPVAVRRSFEVITEPQRFSSQSSGLTLHYDDLISPCGAENALPMSPLLKPNEFSVTMWLYLNESPVSSSRVKENDVFDSLQDHQLVFMRGADHEISLYCILVPESVDLWQLEVGILMDSNPKGRENCQTSRIWERVLSKQAVGMGKWLHVAVVLEATKLRLYLNGILDCQRSLAAQSIPIWAAGNVALPFHFGRFPTVFDSTPTASSISSAIGFLSRSLAAIDQKIGVFRCFNGWLSHFRFHNRSLSPIHVRVVFDEKKYPSGLLSDGAGSEENKLVELHALLLVLSSSSEGIVHFTSQFPDWMRLIWGTFLGSSSVVVQQSALRVLGAIVPLQDPLDAAKVLVQDDTSLRTENLGFYTLDDIFVQQMIRLIGFCLSTCPSSELLGDKSETAVVPWTFMVATGVHANQFSPEIRYNAEKYTELRNDIEIVYQSSKRQRLLLANELKELLQQLFRCSKGWRQSLINVASSITRNASTFLENSVFEPSQHDLLQIGKHTLDLSIIKRVETVGCMYFLGGGVEFLRPGVTVEMRGSRDCAQVLSLEYHASRPVSEATSGTKACPQGADTLAYVRIDTNPSTSKATKLPRLTWYDKVFGLNVDYTDTFSSYSKVNIDDLTPAQAINPNGASRSIIYDLASQQCDYNVLNVVLEKAAEVIPRVFCAAPLGRTSTHVGCMLLKILTQIAGTRAGADEFFSQLALIEVISELAGRLDKNPQHDTLSYVEKRVSALRREVYTALVEFGEELPLRGGNEEELTFNMSRDTTRPSFSQEQTEVRGLSDDFTDRDENLDPAQGDEEEEDDLEEDEEEDEDASLDDVDNDDDEAEAEETRAEFVEELMLMGFPEDWCVLALKQTENDIVSASAWIVDNLEYLSKLQSTLDKERDKGRDSPRYDEEEDDVLPSDDTPNSDPTQSLLLNFSDNLATWRGNDEEMATNDLESSAEAVKRRHKVTQDTGDDDKSVVIPPLNDKEMGRKLFGEMYFPFEDGGFLSNTKSRFLCSWRADALEMTEKSTPLNPQFKASRSVFEDEFEMEISQLDVKDLLEQLKKFETTLAILYARQCMVTLLHQTAAARVTIESPPRFLISYTQWFNLFKLILLRGDQFTIISSTFKTSQLQDVAVDVVVSKALSCFINHDAAAVATSAIEFCLDELETAATSKKYEAILWTQRALQRPDKTVMKEPGVELVSWLLDVLLTRATSSSLTLSTPFVKTVLRRLRCCLGTTNLPLKCIVLRALSRLLIVTGAQDTDVVKDSHLVMGEFLTAAVTRHSRELSQGRLVFSQYLQSYVELLHVLQSLTGFRDLNMAQTLTSTQSFSSNAHSLPPTAPMQSRSEGCSLLFDRKRSRSSLLTFTEDGLSVAYSGNEIWKAACATTSFSTGIHSWLVRIDKSTSPYLFVGVATRQANLDSFLGADDQSWGFIGDKALYYQRNRLRAYGETFTQGDCIGLRLDCEKGELSFSKNGVDLGVAFDNVVGDVCPAVAFYSRHQKISFVKESCVSSESPVSLTGEDDSASVDNCLVACELMSNWVTNRPLRAAISTAAFQMTTEWLSGSTKLVTTRAGNSLWVDVTRTTCGKLGFHCDDRVRTPRGNGLVLGVARGRIWVEVENEPGAWFFHPSKLRLMEMAASTMSSLPIPPLVTPSNTNISLLNARKDSSSDRDIEPSMDSDKALVLETHSSPFSLSLDEFVEYGEHPLWNITLDREVVSVVNDFCEISRIGPWNLTPIQLLHLIEGKTSVLELTAVAHVLEMPLEKREKMLVARFALVRFCNLSISRALPFFDLTWHYFSPASSSLPCRLVSQCRGSLFVDVKNSLWTAIMERTANSPTRADDEYDYPEDLPQLQVNRLKAAAAKCHEGTVTSLFLSLFGQAFEELHFLPLKTLRMVYSHPMDDGQLRSFKVKFEGEGVDDYGGPYREFFSQFFAELQMLDVSEANESEKKPSPSDGGPSSTSLKLMPGVSVSACVLPFLMPSPNWRNGVGANREKFVLNGALIDENVKFQDEGKRQLYCEMFHFLGQMIGICLRTRVCVRLDLAMSVWKQLVGEEDLKPENALETLKEVDFVAYSLWKTLKGVLDELKGLETAGTSTSTKYQELKEQLEAMDLVFTTVLSDGRSVELCEDGTNTAVTLVNLNKYLDAVLQARVQETHQVMNIIKQGLHSIMPVSTLALLTWTELEKRMCGVADVDVKLLQINTEYDEELSPKDEFIQRFWRVLESFEAEDKRAFLRFVWARSRLPLGSAQFHQKFKIQVLASSGTGDGSSASSNATGGWMDAQMPKSHTCFFALQLPRYSSDDICRARLLYAVRNCVEMDGDFRLADTEMTGWAGISPTDQLRI